MKVLVVEDDAVRIAWFRDSFGDALDVTGDVDEAQRWLLTREYDALFLDHDLGTEPKVGRDVAKFLAAHPSVQPRLAITVHSMNIVSAPKIIRDLAEGERHAMWVPFSSLAHA